MNLKQMLARQKEIVDTAQSEGRGLNDAEKREYEELQGKIDEALNGDGDGDGEPHRSTENRGAQSTEDTVHNAVQQAIINEHKRSGEILALCREFNMDPTSYIEGGQSIDEVRKAILEELKKDHGPSNVRVGDDGRDHMIDDISDALLLRDGISVQNPSNRVAAYRGASLKDIAAACLSREDSSSGRDYYLMDAAELFSIISQRQYFNPTAAFPAILDNTVKKAYTEGHKTAPVTFDIFCSKGELKDFKPSENKYVAGSFGEFLEVPEGGELKHTVPKDEKLPQRILKTYGRQFTMSRQAFINDDIGVITGMPKRAAASARITQNKQVYQILVSNPKIYDDKVLFGADHKNLIKTGTGITQDAMQSMIMALGGHKNADGEAVIINPGYVVVPQGYQFATYTLFNSNTIDQNGTVNPMQRYKESVEIVEDATINALAGSGAIPWFLIGNKAYAKFIQVDYLNGQEIPNIRRSVVAGQLGFVWDVYLDWGITVLDYMGAVKNPGVTISSPIAVA